jgi:hypothetical protein
MDSPLAVDGKPRGRGQTPLHGPDQSIHLSTIKRFDNLKMSVQLEEAFWNGWFYLGSSLLFQEGKHNWGYPKFFLRKA